MLKQVTWVSDGKNSAVWSESLLRRNVQRELWGTGANDHATYRRGRRIVYSAVASAAARVTGIAIGLVSVPLLVNYLGVEGYGLWATLTASVAFLGITDLGFGNSLTNATSEAYAINNSDLARKYIASTFIVLTFVALILSIAFLVFHQFVNWAEFFNVSADDLSSETTAAVVAFVMIFILRLPIGLIRNIRMGRQQIYVNAFWQTFGSVLGFCGLIYAIYSRLDLFWLVIFVFGVTIFADIANAGFLMREEGGWLRFQIRDFSLRIAKTMFVVGFGFFLIQASNIVSYQSDSLIISRTLGPKYVTDYVIPLRLFTLASTILAFVLYPMWPAYGEAITRQHVEWVKSALRKTLLLSIVLTIAYLLFLVFFADHIIYLWVGDTVEPSEPLYMCMGLWALLNSISFPLVMFMNGAGMIRFQAVASVVMATANALLTIYLVPRVGVTGAIVGTAVSLGLFFLLPSLYMVYRRINT